MSGYLWFKYMRFNKPGYSLRGGPFTRWRYQYQQALYRKRQVAGPEPIRHRGVWKNWNYDSEVYSFAARLNENFNENLIRQAFTDESYAEAERQRLKDIELPQQVLPPTNNTELAREGEAICKYYIKAILQFWYPKLPNDGIEAVTQYLTGTKELANVAQRLGVTDLIKTEDFPVNEETKQKCMFAIVGALKRSSGVVKAHLLINDFILTQLIGKDINELWDIKNPMGALIDELKKDGIDETKLQPRLLWSTGSNTLTPTYMVGLYLDKKLYSKGSGESVDVAEELAARDALRRMYGTTEDAAQLPYGDKARKYCETINHLYETLQKSNVLNK